MKLNKKSKLFNLLFIPLTGAIAIPISFAITSCSSINPQLLINVPQSYYDYSINNSFQIKLAINSSEASQGTAWSFYLDKSSNNQWDWYLFTNLHVVIDACIYNEPLLNIINPKPNGLVLNHCISARYPVIISKFNPSKFDYQPIVANKDPSYSGWPFANIYSGIELITDYASSNNNQDVKWNLFSNSGNLNEFYNLDMAIVKVKITPKYFNSFENLGVSFAYDNWINNNSSNITYNPSNDIYIGGNPADQKQLIANLMPNDNPFITSPWQKLTFQDSPILNSLYSSYFYSKNPYDNFLLGPGASGSCVYQIPSNLDQPYSYDQFNNLTPVGIYWGGLKLSSQIAPNENLFSPAFTPFVTERYNIFENFKSIFINKQ